MSDYAVGGKDYTAEEAERFIDSMFYDLDEEIESGRYDDLVDPDVRATYGDNSPFYDWEYPETGVYEEPFFDEVVESFCKERGPVSDKESRMLLESDNIIARMIGEQFAVDSHDAESSNLTTEDFQINGRVIGVITGLSSEGRAKIKANDGVIDSFPDGVTAIGAGAFAGSGITAIKDWGEITSIGSFAFENSQITTLPESWGEITDIGSWSFCHNQITTLPESWGEVTSVDVAAFKNNQITTLPESWGEITSIGSDAFSHNQIINLPESCGGVTEVDDSAFDGNQITELPDEMINRFY